MPLNSIGHGLYPVCGLAAERTTIMCILLFNVPDYVFYVVHLLDHTSFVVELLQQLYIT